MKFVGIENNIVQTTNSGSDFLIVSDQPIKKYSYYFELEATTTFKNNGAAVAFIEKDQNNEFVKDNKTIESGYHEIIQYLSQKRYNYTHCYTTTSQYFQNSLNLELGCYYWEKYNHELSIIDNNGNIERLTNNISTTSIYNTSYSRIGFGIEINLDKKTTTISYYYGSNTKNVTMAGRLSINKIFDPDKLYIVIYPQYTTVHHYCYMWNNADNINATSKQISYAYYNFFFNKDEIKFIDLYKKYNHPVIVVEKLEGGYMAK